MIRDPAPVCSTEPPAAAGVATSSDPEQPGELSLRLETSFAGLEGLRAEWDRVAAGCGTVYMSYDWVRTWWEHYGKGRELRLFLFSRGGALVSVVPLYIDRMGIWPMRRSVARLVGANIPPKAFNPPIPPALAPGIFAHILTRLFGCDRCDVFSYGPVTSDHPQAEALEVVARRETALAGGIDFRSDGVQSVFSLPASLDAFFEAMDKDERKKRKYEIRVLRRDPQISEDVLSAGEAMEPEFDSFAQLHARQWIDKGKLGHFGSWPNGLEYNRALARAMAERGRLRYVRILAGTEVISSQYAFSFGNAWYWELPARSVDPKWQRLSLGPAGFFALVEAAIKEGKTRVEGGLAHYDYKRKLNAREDPARTLRIHRAGRGSRLRTRAFLGLRLLFEYAYLKAWYSRISPRLPAALRRPLWPFWLRLDF